jgi:hypothetical protein
VNILKLSVLAIAEPYSVFVKDVTPARVCQLLSMATTVASLLQSLGGHEAKDSLANLKRDMGTSVLDFVPLSDSPSVSNMR